MARPPVKAALITVLAVALIAVLFFALRPPPSDSPDDTAQGSGGASAESTAPPASPGQTPPGGPAAAPGEPAAPGAALERITSPPERSLWALPADTHAAGIRIAVEFEPYGIGPSAYGPSIVALVAKAAPANPASGFPDITGRNVVFAVGGSEVSTGGRYAGTAVTRQHDDRVVLVLEDVRPVP